MTPDPRCLAEIERDTAPPAPSGRAALAFTLAIVAAGVLLIGIPVALILLFA